MLTSLSFVRFCIWNVIKHYVSVVWMKTEWVRRNEYQVSQCSAVAFHTVIGNSLLMSCRSVSILNSIMIIISFYIKPFSLIASKNVLEVPGGIVSGGIVAFWSDCAAVCEWIIYQGNTVIMVRACVQVWLYLKWFQVFTQL